VWDTTPTDPIKSTLPSALAPESRICETRSAVVHVLVTGKAAVDGLAAAGLPGESVNFFS